MALVEINDDGEISEVECCDFRKPRPFGSDAALVLDWGPSMARAEFAAECDINTIMARYEKTGQLPVNGREPVYLDSFAVPGDLMGTLAALEQATEGFMTLPASIRRNFENDPRRFVAFVEDRSNLPQLREWGLAAPAAPAVPSSPAAPPPAPLSDPPKGG